MPKIVDKLDIEQILKWADAHKKRTGKWPNQTSGPIQDAPSETWGAVNNALYYGLRGFPGGSSLPRLLAEHRNHRNPAALPPLTHENILAWADAYKKRTGQWPTSTSGPIADADAPGETWKNVNSALRVGHRGMPGGDCLAQLLAKHRDYQHPYDRPHLTIDLILAWADEHHQRTGEWPVCRSGRVHQAPQENWANIDQCLNIGSRGLPGNSSLAKLLEEHRGRRNPRNSPVLTEPQILAWADAFFQTHEKWPTAKSGVVDEAPENTWGQIHSALKNGNRGLPGGSSLAKLLAKYGRKRHWQRKPPLRVKQILAWADAYFQTYGKWPVAVSGVVDEAPDEKWASIDAVLRHGGRGLPGGSSLPKLLKKYRRRPLWLHKSRLTEKQILAWADAHFEKTGRWPNAKTGAVLDAPGETWAAINGALTDGGRGLKAGQTLRRLLKKTKRI